MRSLSAIRAALAVGLFSILLINAPARATTVLWSDNFDTANGGLDGSSQAGRHTGTYANDAILNSALVVQSIDANQLLFNTPSTTSSRVRFAATGGGFYDFADGAGGSGIGQDILLADGLRIEFDWTPVVNTGSEWISLSAGFLATPEPAFRVVDGGTDIGILFRRGGGTQFFDNGAATTGASFDASVLAPRHITVEYLFDSFGDGTTVTAMATIQTGAGPIETAMNQTFAWSGNGGVLHLELGSFHGGERIDNLVISTVPEPGTWLLGLGTIGGLALAGRTPTPRTR